MAEIMQVIGSVNPDILAGTQRQEEIHALQEAILAQISGIL